MPRCMGIWDHGPTLIGILPYAGLKFYIYEGLKSQAPEDYKDSVILKLSCRALAGLFGQTLTYPLDVGQRQMQVQSKQSQNSSDGFRIRGTFQGLLLIIRCQGWRQLFAGLSLNYVKGKTGSHFESETLPPPLTNKDDWEINPLELDFTKAIAIRNQIRCHGHPDVIVDRPCSRHCRRWCHLARVNGHAARALVRCAAEGAA